MSRRDAILREMGLGPVWKLRQSAEIAAEALVAEANVPAAADPAPCALSAHESAPLCMEAPASAPVQAPASASAGDIANLDWDSLTETILACRKCRLCQARKQAVPGVGDRQADWLFVGEGPGAEEDERGEPFVGQAGKLLDAMLAAIDIKRGEDVYVANSVKCRPPNNRTPEPDETSACWPYLQRQIELIKPRLIVALGRPAAQTLLQSEIKISSARGLLHDYQGIPVIVTYHPAYLLRTPADKSKAWEDLVLARRTMKRLKEGN
ncbi:MAG TPA: uracil-DNA glycosylase [Rhodocyclaceae bacterium]|nr:uracil-DNA glycosylase [Rhodocyclaceae bacterium]